MDHVYRLAELTPDRVPDVAALCRVALDLPDDAAEADAIVGRLREPGPLPGSAGDRRTTGWVALLGTEVVGVVLGSTGYGDPAVGHVDLIAVHPDHRRHGIGRALLGGVEQALAGFGAASVALVGNAPVYAWPGIDVRYTAAVCAARASGYERIGHRVEHDRGPDAGLARAARRRLPRRPGWPPPVSRCDGRCRPTCRGWWSSPGRTSGPAGAPR